MTTQRSYNNIKTLEEAFNELYKSSIVEFSKTGEKIQQFDYSLVNIFVNAINKNEVLIEKFKEQDAKIIDNRTQKKYKK